MRDKLEREIEEALAALVARDAIAVPPYPAVALKLGNLLRTEGYGVPDVVKLVAADATLSADLLRCANSSVNARAVEVRSLTQAVSRLGAKEVLRVAVAATLAKNAQTAGPLETVKRSAWQCGVASAVLCDELAALRGLPREDAFVCGLLHDYGSLIALSGLEEILAEMPEAAARPPAAWVALIARVHVKLGLLLATKWRLPKVFQDAIALHHDDPAAWAGPHAALVDVVATSDAIVRSMVVRSSVDEAALESVPGLSPHERARITARIPEIPTIIASFEQSASPRASAPRASTSPVALLPEGFRRLDLGVRQLQPRKHEYTMCAIAEDGWVMTGKDAIPESSLVQLALACEPEPITLWAHATRCALAAEGGVSVTCKPFAVSGAVSARLSALLRSAAA